MKPIRLSGHARNRLRWWRKLYDVNLADVEQAIREPEELVPGDSGRMNAWRGRRRITYAEHPDRLDVITIVHDPKRRS